MLSLDDSRSTQDECLGRTQWSSPLDLTIYLYYFTSGCAPITTWSHVPPEHYMITWPCHMIWLLNLPMLFISWLRYMTWCWRLNVQTCGKLFPFQGSHNNKVHGHNSNCIYSVAKSNGDSIEFSLSIAKQRVVGFILAWSLAFLQHARHNAWSAFSSKEALMNITATILCNLNYSENLSRTLFPLSLNLGRINFTYLVLPLSGIISKLILATSRIMVIIPMTTPLLRKLSIEKSLLQFYLVLLKNRWKNQKYMAKWPLPLPMLRLPIH